MKKTFYGYELDLGDEPFVDDMPTGADVAAVRIAATTLADGGTFVDVGAHVGTLCVPVAKARPKARVFAFEPVPRNFDLLRANAARHDCENLVMEPFAVGDACTTARLALADTNSQDARLVPPTGCALVQAFGESARVTHCVPGVSLEAYFKDEPLQPPVVVKIDVQGAEVQVLRGMRRLPVAVALIEVWPYGILRQGETCSSLVRELSRWSHGALLHGWLAQPFERGHIAFTEALPWDAASAGRYADYLDVACCSPEVAANATQVRPGEAR